MSKVKPYKEQVENKQIVGEPVVGYSAAKESADYLPDELLVGAIKYAQTAREKGRMIPNGEVYGLLTERFGWK